MKKKCFFLGSVGQEGSYARKWSDQLLKYIIVPVVTDLGYSQPRRVDMIVRGDSISFEILRSLVEDDLVIADLSEGSANVFYELAIRHIIQKPVLHLIRVNEVIPFDLRDINVLHINLDDLSAAEEARQELRSQITLLERMGQPPISFVNQINQLKNVFDKDYLQNDKDVLVNLLNQMELLRQSVEEIKNELADLNNQTIDVQRKDLRSSPFVEKRLAKAELVKKQRGKTKK